MRVMLPGLSDVLEFRNVDGAWMSESGAAVQIAALMPAESQPNADHTRGTARPGLATVQSGSARAN